jgi:branched-chain amino acid transport system substrate-binding protein
MRQEAIMILHARRFGLLLAAACLILGRPAFAEDVVRVGAPLPLTGPLSPEGTKQKQGYELWAETANAAGGIKAGAARLKVELVYADYQSNTPRAVQTAERLIVEDKVSFLFAPVGSGAAKATSSVAEKYEVPMLAPSASSEQVFDQGYKYIFGVLTPNSSLTEPMAELVRAALPAAKTVAILARNDLFPLALAQELEKSAKPRGFEIVYSEKYAIGTLDHASTLTQIRGVRPDWLFVTGYVNDLILVRKQMADLRLGAPVVTMMAGPAYQEFIDATGPAAENVSSGAWWHPAERYQGEDLFGSTESYVTRFKARYAALPDYVQASASACGAVLQLAIERAGSADPKAVRDALAKLDVKTFFGPVRFGANGQIVSYKPPLFQIQGAQAVVIYPPEISQAKLKVGVK